MSRLILLWGFLPLIRLAVLYQGKEITAYAPTSLTVQCRLPVADAVKPAAWVNYYNLKARLVRKISSPDGIARNKLVLTDCNNPDTVDMVIQKCNIIDNPSTRAIRAMDSTYGLSDTSGLEHGFFVGKKGNVSHIVAGTDALLNNNAKQPALNDLIRQDDEVAYDVHTHPQHRPDNADPNHYGSAFPSEGGKDDDCSTGMINRTQASVILGYAETRVYNFNIIYNSDQQTPLKRKIGFYTSVGPITTIDYDDFVRTVRKINRQDHTPAH